MIAETPTPGPDMESAKSGEKGTNQYIEQEKVILHIVNVLNQADWYIETAEICATANS